MLSEEDLRLIEQNDPSLKTLSLRTEPEFIRPEVLVRTWLALKKNTQIHTLSLRGSFLTKEDFHLLGHCLEDNLSLKNLDLSYCQWSFTDFYNLLSTLTEAQYLESLSLEGCSKCYSNSQDRERGAFIGLDGVSYLNLEGLAYIIGQLPHLRSLNLSKNNLSFYGIAFFAKALKGKNLDYLNIGQNCLGPGFLANQTQIQNSTHNLEGIGLFVQLQVTQTLELSAEPLRYNSTFLIEPLQKNPACTKIIFRTRDPNLNLEQHFEQTYALLEKRFEENKRHFYYQFQYADLNNPRNRLLKQFHESSVHAHLVLNSTFSYLTFTDQQNLLAAFHLKTKSLPPIEFDERELALLQHFGDHDQSIEEDNDSLQASSSEVPVVSRRKRMLHFVYQCLKAPFQKRSHKTYLSN